MKKLGLVREEVRKAWQQEFLELVGPLAIVRIMEEHPDSRELQICAMYRLFIASIENDGMKRVIAKVNGMEAILAAMTRFPMDHDRLHIWALEALRYLCSLLSLSSMGANVIVSTMNRFHYDVYIVEKSCFILEHLACVKELRPALLNSNVASTLAVAFETRRMPLPVALSALHLLTSSE